ncbi:MAG: hypothetical protein JSV88_09960 [Candidatus Aminicenantes bacterium]|nr:MAG: hypothetical protein JSV88_09960 [Candidatus Aminicenantes bacterium]
MLKNTMLKKMVIFSLIVFAGIFLFPANLGTVNGVLKPNMIEVAGHELYIVEGAVISVYSLNDLQLIRQFGRDGEGPGELKVVPYYNNRVSVFPDFILAESVDKLIYFSKEGAVIKQVKKPVESGFFTPVGKNFVGKKVKRDPGQKTTFIVIVLYDLELHEIKELYRQKFAQQVSGRNVTIQLFVDLVNFQVWDNKIFIEKSPEGFLIDVFDHNGKALYQIKREYEKTKITGAHKEAAIKEIKEDPTIKRRIKQFGSWENLLKMMKFTFPEFMPAIQYMEIADGRIYARTFQKKNNKEEYIVIDLEGKMLRRTYIPRVHPLSLKDQLIGVKMAVIRNDKLYYLKENEEQEVWQLHVYEINQAVIQ